MLSNIRVLHFTGLSLIFYRHRTQSQRPGHSMKAITKYCDSNTGVISGLANPSPDSEILRNDIILRHQ